MAESFETLKSESHLRAIFNSSAVGIAVIDRSHRILDGNAKLHAMLGFSPDALKGRSIFDLKSPGETGSSRDILNQLARGRETSMQLEKTYVREDGGLLPARITVALISGGDDHEAFATAVFEDLTDRRLAEMRERAAKEELARSNDQLKIIIESVAEGIMVQDSQLKIIYANRTAAEICGFDSAAEMMRATVPEVLEYFEVQSEEGIPLSPEEMPALRALRGESPPEMGTRARNKRTGRVRCVRTTSRPIFDSAGKPTLAVSVLRERLCDLSVDV